MSTTRDAIYRLASYGTLAPGQSNFAQVSMIEGRWTKGTVRGHRTQADWGQWVGYPGFKADPEGAQIDVFILESPALPNHWDRLDAFEGEAYERITITAHSEDGPVEANIYQLRPAP